jgi:hypothetical protein
MMISTGSWSSLMLPLKKLTKKKKQKVYYKNSWNGWWPGRVLP